MTTPTKARRWKAADRPALFPPVGSGALPASGWELCAINSKTATFRHTHLVGELADSADAVRVMDPAPWVITEGEKEGERLPWETDPSGGDTPPTVWEPRTLAQLRAAGVLIGADQRSPFDTGQRAEPREWSHATMHAISRMVGREVAEELDRFGRVDFEDDAGSTVAIVHAGNTGNGWTVDVYDFMGDGLTVRETSEDGHPDMRAALTTYRAEMKAYAAACDAEEESGLEKDAESYYARDDAAVAFAEVAAAWIAARLGIEAAQ
ncbi:hypothetical protein MRBLMI12_000461 [Microbacterium sp. LMI12-1-1.1]|uniref:hypothetical protein n=1 Tax=Microbacterium sp. LMI12-1-1.1 TaxID=3135225 RepID=UPI0034184BC3